MRASHAPSSSLPILFGEFLRCYLRSGGLLSIEYGEVSCCPGKYKAEGTEQLNMRYHFTSSGLLEQE